MSKPNAAFWKWFGDSKVVDTDGNPLVVYHGTNANFRKFNTKKSTQGVIWFSSDRDKIARGDAGAAGRSKILELFASIQRPAGWKEYDKLLLSQLRRDYDGAILPDGYGGFDGFVFDPTQLKSIDNDGTWDADDASIRSNPAPRIVWGDPRVETDWMTGSIKGVGWISLSLPTENGGDGLLPKKLDSVEVVEIQDLFVEPKHRHHGFGAMLVKGAIKKSPINTH